MAKRARNADPEYLYFVTIDVQGECLLRRFNLLSTVKGDEIEKLFDAIEDRRGQNKDCDRRDGNEYPFTVMEDVMTYIGCLMDDEFEEECGEAAKHIRGYKGLEFPFSWSRKDWGIWENEPHNVSWTQTKGKHYFYISYW
jgi:hypothetical protein